MTSSPLTCGDVAAAMVRRRFRWRCADPVLMPHQRTGATRVVELLDRFGGALLADEVGLGKSWIAAAAGREFVRRGQTVQLVIPASLTLQWQKVLSTFGLAARITTHDSLRGHPTIPGDRRDELLIVDEAHRFRNPATLRHRALALEAVGRRILLVTATPICNRPSDLLSILRIAFPDDALQLDGVSSLSAAFQPGREEDLARVLTELMVRRSREAIVEQSALPELERKVVRYRLTGDNGDIPQSLAGLQFPLIARMESDRKLLRQVLWRRLESSPAALLDSLRRQRRFYRRARESLLGGARLTRADYRRLFGDDDETEPFQELLFRELWTAPAEECPETLAEVVAELQRLDRLVDSLRSATDGKRALLERSWRELGGAKSLLFTGAIATAVDIFEAASPSHRAGLVTSGRCSIGPRRAHDASEVFAALQSGALDLVVSTDLSSEGVNLQEAEVVIHYDLPWNPVKLEQRNGRIRRLGQRRSRVRALYFLPERSSDRAAVLPVLARKNRRRNAILGSERFESALMRMNRRMDRAAAAGDAFSDGAHARVVGAPALLAIVATGDVERVMCDVGGSTFELQDFLAIRGEEEVSLAGQAALPSTGELIATVESRRLLRCRVEGASSQLQLAKSVKAARLETASLTRWLSLRYREGLEIVIGQMAGEYLDRERLRWLEDLMRHERSLVRGTDGDVRVIASVRWTEDS